MRCSCGSRRASSSPPAVAGTRSVWAGTSSASSSRAERDEMAGGRRRRSRGSHRRGRRVQRQRRVRLGRAAGRGIRPDGCAPARRRAALRAEVRPLPGGEIARGAPARRSRSASRALREHMRTVADLAVPRRGADGLDRRTHSIELAARCRAPRHREARDPARDPREAGRALASEEWHFIRRHAVVGERIISRRAGDARDRRGSSAPPTSAGTAAATPTVSREQRSRSPRGSSPSATRTAR